MRVDVPRLLEALGVQPTSRDRTTVWARCPVHRESEASWSILIAPPNRAGSHHCFGCGFEGGPLDLVMEVVEGVDSLRQAADWVRERSLEIGDAAPLNGVRLTVRSRAARAFSLPPEVLQPPLYSWVTPARRYAEGRGLTAGEVGLWRIGYAVDGRLAGRVVFPIRDDRLRLLSYTARSFAGEEPRYKGPAEREGASPGAVFGEERWPPPEERSRSTLVLCEGAINGLACLRAGAAHVGALGGSSYDSWQVMKVRQFGQIVLATDLDLAGDKVAGELRAALARHSRVERATMPEGMDPADLWLRDPGELRRLLWG